MTKFTFLDALKQHLTDVKKYAPDTIDDMP